MVSFECRTLQIHGDVHVKPNHLQLVVADSHHASSIYEDLIASKSRVCVRMEGHDYMRLTAACDVSNIQINI